MKQERSATPRSDWPKVWNLGPLSIGLFNYWIGISWRRVGTQWRTLDLGYLKFMTWGKR